MRKNPRRILSPQRLPFRHPGIGSRTKLACTACMLKLNLNSEMEERSLRLRLRRPCLQQASRTLRVPSASLRAGGMTVFGGCMLKAISTSLAIRCDLRPLQVFTRLLLLPVGVIWHHFFVTCPGGEFLGPRISPRLRQALGKFNDDRQEREEEPTGNRSNAVERRTAGVCRTRFDGERQLLWCARANGAALETGYSCPYQIVSGGMGERAGYLLSGPESQVFCGWIGVCHGGS
jgi:hypothetical protein